MTKLSFLITALFTGLFMVACQNEEEIKANIKDDCLTTNSARRGEIIEDEYIVSFSPSADAGGRVKSAQAILLEDHAIPSSSILNTFEGKESHFVMRLSEKEVANLKTDKNIARVEPDRIISICACFTVIEPRSVTWNVDKVGYSDGTGKTAWIIDTGIDSDHPDLNVNKTLSKTFLQGETSYEDDNGHGTHIGGIIGALNNRVGTLGIASGASLVGLKVLDENGDGKLSSLLNALTYIDSKAKAGDVVNISVGFTEASETLESEIRAIAGRGIYFALAAGNESGSANTYSPARTAGKNIYTVSAIDSLNRFADFSNFGNDVVDFAAPGVRILSTYMEGKYAILSGTSMAAPHVAGLLLINDGKINSKGFAVSDPDGNPDAIAHK
jgi:hypothetical protein